MRERNGRVLKAKTKESISGYVFLTPFVIGFSVFVMLPLIATFFLALTDWNLFESPEFVGTDNFKDLLTNNDYFWPSMRATFEYVTGGVILPQLAALLLAVLLNQKIRMRGFFRAVYYLPCILPAASTIILWQWMFNPDMGILNALLRAVGLPTSRWIYGEDTVMLSLWIMAIWSCGSTALIYLAALQNVPRQLQEAAHLDGAGSLRRFFHVSLPCISPVVFFNLLMGIIGAIQVFTPAQLMTGGGPNNRTLFAAYYIYWIAFTENRMGYACALAVILFIVTTLFAIVVFKTSNKWVFYNEEKN